MVAASCHCTFGVSGFCVIQNWLALALPIWERDLTPASAGHGTDTFINTLQHNNTSTILCAIEGRRAITRAPTTWLYSNYESTPNRPMAYEFSLAEITFSAVGGMLDYGKTNSLRSSLGLPCHHSAHCRCCPSECMHIWNRRATLGVFIPKAACPSFFFVVFTIRDKKRRYSPSRPTEFYNPSPAAFLPPLILPFIASYPFSLFWVWLQVKFPAQTALHTHAKMGNSASCPVHDLSAGKQS